MKYVMLRVKEKELVLHVPIIFPEILIHAQVARAIKKNCAKMASAEAVSAGSINVKGKIEPTSKSTTLGLKPDLPKDQEIIDGIDHGSMFMFS